MWNVVLKNTDVKERMRDRERTAMTDAAIKAVMTDTDTTPALYTTEYIGIEKHRCKRQRERQREIEREKESNMYIQAVMTDTDTTPALYKAGRYCT